MLPPAACRGAENAPRRGIRRSHWLSGPRRPPIALPARPLAKLSFSPITVAVFSNCFLIFRRQCDPRRTGDRAFGGASRPSPPNWLRRPRGLTAQFAARMRAPAARAPNARMACFGAVIARVIQQLSCNSAGPALRKLGRNACMLGARRKGDRELPVTPDSARCPAAGPRMQPSRGEPGCCLMVSPVNRATALDNKCDQISDTVQLGIRGCTRSHTVDSSCLMQPR